MKELVLLTFSVVLSIIYLRLESPIYNNLYFKRTVVIWYILSKGIGIDWVMVNKKMAYYNRKVVLEDLIHKINGFDQKKLKLDLGKFLPLKQRKIAENIKEMLLEKLSKLAPCM